METKVLAAGAVGAGIGAAQTPLLRQYVDSNNPTLVESLGGFGSPSALAGIIGGIAGLVIGAVGKSRKNGVQRYSDSVVMGATDYGITALVGGALSGAFPAVPPVSTVSMRSPRVRRAMSPGMSAVSRMSAELNRLSQENSALRAQVQQDDSDRINGGPIAPGSVPDTTQVPAFAYAPGQPVPRATEFGFMQNNEEEEEGELVPPRVFEEGIDTPGPLAPERLQPAPGQPTRRATRYGFMQQGLPSTPISKVQQMKGKYDFLG